jgi:hypothetical protein
LSGRRPTRAEAIGAAGESIALAHAVVLGLDGTSVQAAARAALTPTGPSYDDLVDRITRRRIEAGLLTDPATEHKAAS